MEERTNDLAEKAWTMYKSLPASRRLLIGVAGIPGSGKTTFAAKIVHLLNEKQRTASPAASCGSRNPIAAFIPMDGYHLTRAQLSAMPDPETAHARRGAAFTFDGEKFLALVRALREPLTPEARTVYAPSFDHALKDPVEDAVPIAPGARVCVFEGLYIALDREPWREAGALMDEVWFVEVDEPTARKRLVRRHMDAGLAADEIAAARRADENDLVNGREIMANRVKVHELIHSVDEKTWAPDHQGGHLRDGESMQNGHMENGHKQNGHMQNGHLENGHTVNGHMENGHMQNGHLSNGVH